MAPSSVKGNHEEVPGGPGVTAVSTVVQKSVGHHGVAAPDEEGPGSVPFPMTKRVLFFFNLG